MHLNWLSSAHTLYLLLNDLFFPSSCSSVGSVTHLDVSDEELRRCFHRCFGIDDLLDGAGPVHSLVEVLGVEPVAVLPPVHRDAPVA